MFPDITKPDPKSGSLCILEEPMLLTIAIQWRTRQRTWKIYGDLRACNALTLSMVLCEMVGSAPTWNISVDGNGSVTKLGCCGCEASVVVVSAYRRFLAARGVGKLRTRLGLDTARWSGGALRRDQVKRWKRCRIQLPETVDELDGEMSGLHLWEYLITTKYGMEFCAVARNFHEALRYAQRIGVWKSPKLNRENRMNSGQLGELAAKPPDATPSQAAAHEDEILTAIEGIRRKN